MPVWLVTGGSGFIGRHVLERLATVSTRDDTLLALGRKCPSNWDTRRFVSADLERPESVGRALNEVLPDFVVHAAGQTPPAEPDEFYRANTLGTLHLLDALREKGRPCRVVLVGSAAELGPVEAHELPVGEDHPCRPSHSYGLSKFLATCAGLASPPPVDVVAARVFNPIGPGQPPNQAFGRFAAALARREDAPLVVHGLDARRDFIDVRDVAGAMIALAERGQTGLVYHVGTGASRSVGEGLHYLVGRFGGTFDIRADPPLPRAAGGSDSRADVRRIVAHTGWRAEIPWETSLDDLCREAAVRSGCH